MPVDFAAISQIAFPYKELTTKVLSAGLMAAGVLWARERFRKAPKPISVGKKPTNLRYWTTAYNYYPAELVYVSILIFIFIFLENVPDLTLKVFDAFKETFSLSKGVQDFIKSLQQKPQEYGLPLITAFVAAGLIASDKAIGSPIDGRLREYLLGWAAIPDKVRTVIDQIKTAHFDDHVSKKNLTNKSSIESSKEKVWRYLNSLVEESIRKEFRRAVRKTIFEDRIQVASALQMELERWLSKESELSDLAADCSAEIKNAENELKDAVTDVKALVALMDSEKVSDAEIEEKRSEIDSRLKAIQDLQGPIFACGLLQSSALADRRREYVRLLGIIVTERPSPYFVFKSLRGDLATLVLLLIFVAYPVACLVTAFLFPYPSDKPISDFVFVFPLMVAAFILSAVLPCLYVFEQNYLNENAIDTRQYEGRYRWHTFSYLAIVPLCLVLMLVSLIIVQYLTTSFRYLSLTAGFKNIGSFIQNAAPFGLVAAVIGVTTALLFDIHAEFKARPVIDGVITAVFAVIAAAIAVLVQIHLPLSSMSQLLHDRASVFQSYPRLRHAGFDLPVVGLVSFTVGAIIPSGYRRYRRGLLIPGAAARDAARGATDAANESARAASANARAPQP